ncbi:MAG: M48 family metallopeptidase, partial [Bacteroidales bacterium]|nr:M48 family metallopeptidase [Bacteroidales bacterium]
MYNTIFVIIIAVLVFGYVLERILDTLNLKHSLPELPEELSDIFDPEEYKRSQLYKRDNTRFSFISSSLSLIVLLLVFILGGFGWLDRALSGITSSYILLVLLFFGVLALVSDILTTPFALYGTFVIEERYGFNRTTVKTFILDKLKGWLLGLIIGGGLLVLITRIYQLTGSWFWLIALGVITLFSVFMTMFYSNLIVPLFNKQKPLEEGSLRSKIEAFAQGVSFKLDNIYVMDGSKRSSKANAYFTGLGPRKRIVLFDTLIKDLEEEEIVAVLAHEVGHYKKKHTTTGLILSTLQTALTLYLLGLFIGVDIIAEALGGTEASFHLGLIAFGVLYSPVSMLIGIGTNLLTRHNEYQADRFAREHHDKEKLISSLKKLSKNTLSNLTPHPSYVFFHYSHPPLLQR